MKLAPVGGKGALAVVIVAYGADEEMPSAIPTPLHRVGSASLLSHVLRSALPLGAGPVVLVVERGADAVVAEARRLVPDIRIVEQAQCRGPGDAIRAALPAVEDAGRMLLLSADRPLIRTETLLRLAEAQAKGAAMALIGFKAPAGSGEARVIRDASGSIRRIVDAAEAARADSVAPLCSSDMMMVDLVGVRRRFMRMRTASATGECCLGGLVAVTRAEGEQVALEICAAPEAMKVTSYRDLALAEASFQNRARRAAMAAGAMLVAPDTVFFSWDTRVGRDVGIGPNVVFGPGVTLMEGALVEAFSHLEGCIVREGARVGPFARLRPGADIGPGAHVGNFVEIKNAVLGAGAKANHLAYLGDASVGAGSNIGAGAVTCNYDGATKHRTEIGEGAFVGTNVSLVAPVEIGAGAYVGSGSVITEDVPSNALALGRARQTTKPGGAIRLRARRATPPSTRSA